jgi:hypothetical protein
MDVVTYAMGLDYYKDLIMTTLFHYFSEGMKILLLEGYSFRLAIRYD